MMNPLLADFKHTFGLTPFDQIKNEHYLPALKSALAEAEEKIGQFKESKAPVTFENSVLALEALQEKIETIAGVFFNLHSAESNEELQKIAKDFSPLITKFSNDVALDEKVFEKIRHCHDAQNELCRDPEQKRLVEKLYKSFTRNGALLPNDKKQKLRTIDEELSKLSLQFSDNVLAATNSYQLEITNENDLQGLPDSAKEAAKLTATEKGKPNSWVFTLHAPSLVPFLTYADNRKLRQELFMASATKATTGETNNQPVLRRMVELRIERAKLLGFKNHAHYVLEERMAQSQEKVSEFTNHLMSKAKPVALQDVAELNAFKEKKGDKTPLERWDYAYWSEKLKKEKFAIDDEILRPYFKMEKVVEGVFAVAKRLYGLNFLPLKDAPVYHSEVQVFEVRDENNKHIGIFYMDLFPRAGKRGGAWMTNFRDQGLFKGKIERPHVAIVCNFTRSTPDRPSLLSFQEVLTLFHEFGHSLHGLLSQCTYRSLSGTNVYWDFVELPSQILENWVYEKECLDMFAVHYQSQEKIPQDFIKKIQESSRFHEGLGTLRQLSFSMLDMAWHTLESMPQEDVLSFENKVTAGANLFPQIVGANNSCSFSHIFSGGYSSGYYSYKWAEVLDADAFEYFKEKGIFNPEVAKKFKDNVLSRGGSEHPMELYKRFRGQEPNPDALLRRGGLIA